MSGQRNWLPRIVVFGLLVFTAGCERRDDVVVSTDTPRDSVAPIGVEPATLSLIDSAIVPAVAGEGGWMYSQAAQADLDGDGEPERVVLTARAELVRGRPAWDDGQPWQVYVEDAGGERTYLYARFVQLGTLTMRVGRGDGAQGVSVILVEHLPDRIAVYEAEYHAPGQIAVVERFWRELDPTGDVASPMLP